MNLVEVGPRDGLQSEQAVLDPQVRIELIRRCIAAGATRIEVASFVDPRVVPQMAGAEEVCAAVAGTDDVSTIGVVLNERGLDRALETAVDEINLVAYAADGYSRKNTGAAAAERNDEAAQLAPRARAAGRRVTVTISVAFGDPFDGEVEPGRVAELAGRIAAAGVDEIALGDTIGVAAPADVTATVAAVRAVTEAPVRCHFHNTRNTGYANVAAALGAGVTAVDASIGGYGGSPFAPEAGGNVATEDVTYLLSRMGVDTGIDLAAATATSRWLADRLGDELPPSMVARAGGFPR